MFESHKNFSELHDRYSDRNVFVYLLDMGKLEKFKDRVHEIDHIIWMHKNQSIKKKDLVRYIKELNDVISNMSDSDEKTSFQTRVEIFEKLLK